MIQPRAAPGNALFVAIAVMTVGLAMMCAMVGSTRNNVVRTNSSEVLDQNYFAAKGATELALGTMWGAFNNDGSVNFPAYLDTRFTWTTVTPDTSKIWILNDFAKNYPASPTPSVFKYATWTSLNGVKFCNTLVTQVRLYRVDRPADSTTPGQSVTDVLVVAEAQRDLGYGGPTQQLALATPTQQTVNGEAVSYSQLLTFARPPKYNGLDFAMLSKNIDCACCHMRVTNLSRVMNKLPKNYGSYERVKVGTTQSLTMRSSSAATLIEGTLYQRGTLAEEGGGPMSVKTFCTCGNMNMVKFQTNSTAVYENSSGVATTVAPNNATTNSSYNPISTPPATRQNTYLNYGMTSTLETDGNLPTASDFPAPFVDGNNDRKIDSTEVSAAKADIQSIATSLTGGIGVKLAAGALYSGTALPTTGTASINAGNAVGGGSDAGNFIFVGTQSNPVQLNGKVVIDGDVMLSGYVQGSGQIWATGNIYVPSDVQYADKTDSNGEVFGVNAQGTPNLLAMVAGGNIVVGDYLSQVNDWQSSQTNFFTLPATPDLGHWTNTAKLSTGNWLDGQNAPHNADGTLNVTQAATTTTNRNNPFANFVNEELSVFNRNEFQNTLLSMPKQPSSGNMDITSASTYSLTNPLLDSTFIPRYYSMYSANAADPTKSNFGAQYTQNVEINVFSGYNYKNSSGSSTTETGTYWDSTNQQWAPKGDPHCYGWMTDLTKIPASVQSPTAVSNKVVLNIHPDWISPANMQMLLTNAEAARTDDTPRRLDGLLYTNNAVFAIERQKALSYNASKGTWSSGNSKSRGRMTVNGAIIAPDLGVLVTGSYPYSFVLNWDARVRGFLPLAAKTQTWGMLRKGCSRYVGALPSK